MEAQIIPYLVYTGLLAILLPFLALPIRDVVAKRKGWVWLLIFLGAIAFFGYNVYVGLDSIMADDSPVQHADISSFSYSLILALPILVLAFSLAVLLQQLARGIKYDRETITEHR